MSVEDTEATGAVAPAKAAGDAETVLTIRSLSKEFPGTRALNEVDLDARRGEIHALCGGNGSGKSTLIKILCGVYQGDAGEINCGGVDASADHMTPAIAEHMGVRVVHQDLGVFPDLTVAENMSLGRGFETGRGGRVQWRKVRNRTRTLIERFEIPATPRTLMRSLSRAAQTQVAIARALQDQDSSRPGILILDEPTSSLPVHEVELLLSSLRRYASEGQSIIYVSHRLDEILNLSDRVTILRDGIKTGTWKHVRPDRELADRDDRGSSDRARVPGHAGGHRRLTGARDRRSVRRSAPQREPAGQARRGGRHRWAAGLRA
jgi:ribose transport system ATP-binding protein